MAWNYSNTSVQTTLTAPIGPSDTSIQIGTTSGLPVTFPFSLVLDYQQATVEVVTVTSLVGSTLTVTRAQDGTSAQSHPANAQVVHGVVARDVQEPQAHMAASGNVHGVGVGSGVVGTATIQALTGKTMDGNANTFTNIGTAAITSLDASKITQPFQSMTVDTPNGATTALTVLANEAGRSVPVANIAALNNAVNIDEDGTLTLDRGDLNVDAARAHLATGLLSRAFVKASGKIGLIIQKALVGDTFDLQQWRDSAGTVLAKANSNGTLFGRGLISRPQAGDVVDLLSLQDSTGAALAKVDINGKLLAATVTSTGVLTATANVDVGGTIQPTGETWHTLGMAASWVNVAGAATPKYRKLASPATTVEVVGTVQNGTSAQNTTIATLPAGYRPASLIRNPIYAFGASLSITAESPAIDVDTSGNLILKGCAGGSGATLLAFHLFIPLDA